MNVLRITAILALILCQPIQAHPPQATLAIAADLYLTGAQSVYRVDLHTGWSQHVGDLDATIQHLAYDSDGHTLYGIGYRQIIQPNGDIEHGLYRIDTHTWACTYITQLPASPPSPNGSGGAVYPSLCYDHTTGWLYGTVSWQNGNTVQGVYKIHPKTLELVFLGYVDPMGNSEGHPVWYSAADPMDGSLYAFQDFGAWVNRQLDKDTGNMIGQPFASTTPEPPRFGPAAFYPGTHTLYRYAWDGSGNAWLYHVDLATGHATKASVPFTAPGHCMTFLPSLTLARKL